MAGGGLHGRLIKNIDAYHTTQTEKHPPSQTTKIGLRIEIKNLSTYTINMTAPLVDDYEKEKKIGHKFCGK